jgi:hypothetical protein
MRPLLFIGCSSESLEVAYGAQANLQDVADVVVWDQGIFGLSQNILDALLDRLDDSQFGLFIFAPDDLVKIRGTEMRATRDNVIFEVGLFIGRLGVKRTFIILPKNAPDLHLPADIMGRTAATYMPFDRPGLWQSALAPACRRIKAEIEAVLKRRAQQTASEQLSHYEWRHLINLANGKVKAYVGRASLRSELRHLRDIGLVKSRPGKHIKDMAMGRSLNLSEYIELTAVGSDLVAGMQK